MDRHKLITERLADLLKEVNDLYQFAIEDEPKPPPEALEKLENGICLKCNKKITKAQQDKERRGVHEKCYRQNNRDVNARKTTDAQLVREGKWMPAKSKRNQKLPAVPAEIASPLRIEVHDPKADPEP